MTEPVFDSISSFSVIQTFFADPEIVFGSGEISLTSIDLFLRSKPNTQNNMSGMPAPGVIISICEVQNETPELGKVYRGSSVRKAYNEVYSFSDASTPTSFGFAKPLKLKTNRFYGIVVQFEDPGYELWVNKQGDKLVGTNVVSPGSNLVKDGKLFLFNNSNVFRAISDTDLKFAVKVAKYTSNNQVSTFTNKHLEFLTLSNAVGSFIGGEYVYAVSANATGNVSISSSNNLVIGTGTDFTTLEVGTKLVVFCNSSISEVTSVSSITNATSMTIASSMPIANTNTKYSLAPIGRVYYRDGIANKLFLTDSNANTSNKFDAGDIVVGADSRATANIASVDVFNIDAARLGGDISVPAAGRADTTLRFTLFDGSAYRYNSNNSFSPKFNDRKTTHIDGFDAKILSRSLEVMNANLYSNADLLIVNKSLVMNLSTPMNASNSNLFTCTTTTGDLDLYSTKFNISNTTIESSLDTEVKDNGISKSRHISKKLTFANNRFAEDLRVIVNAHRPANTDLQFYARLYNSSDPEAFDDKAWTPLEYKENGSRYSSSTDRNDIVEYTLGLSQYPETANALPGSFTTQSGNTVMVGSGIDPSTYVANNDVVRLYNPLIPENYIVGVAVSVNSTAITLGKPISNNNVIGSGLKVDKVKYPNITFNNVTNDNVARYYNSSLVEFDTFDSVQLKIVPISDTTYVVPTVDSVSVIGVSS